MTWAARDIKNIWHPYTQAQGAGEPVVIVKGEGTYLYDDTGKRYIDAISSWWVNLHGHAHPYIAKKIAAQAATLEQVIFAGFSHPPAIELAERLLEKLPLKQSRIFYSDNGSTAVEVAVKIALQYWSNQGKEKKQMLALKDAYHGDTFGSMSVSGRSVFTQPFAKHLFDVTHLDVPHEDCINDILLQLESIACTGKVAAFIYEPLLMGTAGMRMYKAELFDQMLRLCKKHRILLIADEVLTGFYRTGKFLASDYLSEKPDIICLSKGITGGFMPLGVTSCTSDIFSVFLSDDDEKTFFHGHSYTANPLACAASLANLDLLEEKDFPDRIRQIETLHRQFVQKINSHKAVANARTLGTVLAITLKNGGQTSYFNPVKKTAIDFFRTRGILIRPLGNVLYVLPPYCISSADLAYVYGAIETFLETLK